MCQLKQLGAGICRAAAAGRGPRPLRSNGGADPRSDYPFSGLCSASHLRDRKRAGIHSNRLVPSHVSFALPDPSVYHQVCIIAVRCCCWVGLCKT